MPTMALFFGVNGFALTSSGKFGLTRLSIPGDEADVRSSVLLMGTTRVRVCSRIATQPVESRVRELRSVPPFTSQRRRGAATQ